jgi:apolipoprotein D and lipocalin family protein
MDPHSILTEHSEEKPDPDECQVKSDFQGGLFAIATPHLASGEVLRRPPKTTGENVHCLPGERLYPGRRSFEMRTTKKILIAGSLVTVGALAVSAMHLLERHPVGNAHVPEPTKTVDLQRYLGRWYEIARYEQRFERGCQAATAEYSLREDGKIDVVNRCKRNGRLDEARGVAKVVDQKSNTKLKVSFFWPFYGDYWILDHADDYSWSIVGDPSGRYLWILSREADPSSLHVRELISRAAALGYDTSMLVMGER